jgi:hypothetical protein
LKRSSLGDCVVCKDLARVLAKEQAFSSSNDAKKTSAGAKLIYSSGVEIADKALAACDQLYAESNDAMLVSVSMSESALVSVLVCELSCSLSPCFYFAPVSGLCGGERSFALNGVLL